MKSITNTKIGFSRYPGFSLLFDNPGNNNLIRFGKKYRKIRCQVHIDPQLELYKALTESLNKIGLKKLFRKYQILPLAPSTYHVTVLDGLNYTNVYEEDKYLKQDLQEDFNDFLCMLPCSLAKDTTFSPLYTSSDLVHKTIDIEYTFKKLGIWSSGIVACLEPVKSSRVIAATIRQYRRDTWNSINEKLFENEQEYSRYTPHVSLGYFCNKKQRKQTLKKKKKWNKIFKKFTSGKTISFKSIALYGFTDMETFFTSA